MKKMTGRRELYGLKLIYCSHFDCFTSAPIEILRFVIMSLFSRLEERMRARDSQDDSKEKPAKSEPEKGGLFGSIELGPAEEETSVPPPSTADESAPATNAPREVPSIVDARAEFDRARAELGTGWFRRNAEATSDQTDEVPLDETAHASFGAVSLPPVANDNAEAPDVDASTEMPMPQPLVSSPVAEQSLISTPEIDAEIAPPPMQPPATESGIAPDETVIYAPTAPAESQGEEARDFVPAMEQSRTAEIIEAPVETLEMSVAETPKIEDKSTPVVRPGGNSNLTPFQRLMAARAAQGGPPVSRPRIERPAPVVHAPVTQTPVIEPPVIEPPVIEPPVIEPPVVETPVAELPVAELPEVETLVAETLAVEAPIAETPEVETLAVEAPIAETPVVETPEVEAPVNSTTNVEVPEAQVPEAETSEVDTLETQAPEVETPVVEESANHFEEVELPAQEAIPQIEVPTEEVSTEEVPAEEIEQSEHVVASESSSEESRDGTMDELIGEPQAQETYPIAEAPSVAEALADAVAQYRESSTTESDATESEPVAETVIEESIDDALPEQSPRVESELVQVPDAVADAAPEESEPEPVAETMPAEPSRTAAPVSFAERLAARKRLQEAPAEVASKGAPAADAPAVDEVEAPPTPMNLAPPPAPNETPQRSAPRSFSERLASRTGLDRNLQAPVEEAATPQDLAKQSAELARIDQSVELSEREMKNRVLFRQKNLMFDAVVGSLDQRALQNPTREIVKPQIERAVDNSLREFEMALEPVDRNWLVDEFVRETTDLGALVPMLEDPSVSKIVVTGANDVSVERLGRVERTGISFRDDDHLLSIVRRMAEMSGGRVDAKVPLLDRPLPDGGRIRAKVPPLAPLPTLTIEKSTGNPFVALKRQMDDKSRNEALPYAQLRERIQQRLLREFEGDAAALGGDQEKLREQVEEMIGSVIAEERVAVTRAERASLVMDLLNEIVGLGPIEPLLNDPDIDEVMVNGPYQIYVERRGKLELSNQRFRDNAHVMQVIDRIVAPLGRRVDEKSPMVDGRLRDGSRFNAVIPPLALSGPTMTIRKFARDPFTMSDLINFGTLTREAAQFLQAAVEGRLNIIVSGGTGSGKTTTLNVLSSFIPSTERIVTIEDAAELQMRQEHVIRMETRPPNIEGVGEVGIRDLVRNSLRMRPDRIVVGECRGGEALDMLQAMNTGHDGSLTTAHSNGPRDTCKRLETMVMMAGFDLPVRAIREQISMAVQLIVHQERMRDGKRRVTAITEIVGMESDVLTLQDIFRFVQEGIDEEGRIIGGLQATGMRPKYYETIVDNGVQLSMDLFAPKPYEASPRPRLGSR